MGPLAFNQAAAGKGPRQTRAILGEGLRQTSGLRGGKTPGAGPGSSALRACLTRRPFPTLEVPFTGGLTPRMCVKLVHKCKLVKGLREGLGGGLAGAPGGAGADLL